MKLYSESPDAGRKHREQMLSELEALVIARQAEADRRRATFFRPDASSLDAYAASTARLRRAFIRMLGWPLTSRRPKSPPAARLEHVADDDLGSIHRVWIETLPGLHTYGLFFQPKDVPPPHPLVISQHGGGGTPELCSGVSGDSANYNDMTRRLLRRGAAVFAPQLLLWTEAHGPKHDRAWYDRRLKNMGGSIAALEIHRISRSLDYFASRADIDPARMGIIGLSYGGFYALFTAAADPRLRVTVSSCFFSDRRHYDWPDWTWFDAMNRFQDAEVAQLVCPRALYIEVGQKDQVFDIRHPGPEAEKVSSAYERLGVPDRFRYHEHPGDHELNKAAAPFDFLFGHL